MTVTSVSMSFHYNQSWPVPGRQVIQQCLLCHYDSHVGHSRADTRLAHHSVVSISHVLVPGWQVMQPRHPCHCISHVGHSCQAGITVYQTWSAKNACMLVDDRLRRKLEDIRGLHKDGSQFLLLLQIACVIDLEQVDLCVDVTISPQHL